MPEGSCLIGRLEALGTQYPPEKRYYTSTAQNMARLGAEESYNRLVSCSLLKLPSALLIAQCQVRSNEACLGVASGKPMSLQGCGRTSQWAGRLERGAQSDTNIFQRCPRLDQLPRQRAQPQFPTTINHCNATTTQVDATVKTKGPITTY